MAKIDEDGPAVPDSHRAARVNLNLLNSGLTQGEANLWWNTHSAGLGGRTPVWAWLKDDEGLKAMVEALAQSPRGGL